MLRRPEYPFIPVANMPTADEYINSLVGAPICINGEKMPDPGESYAPVPTGKSYKGFWGRDVAYISTGVCRANPLFMSICIHREVWDELGYFSVDMGGDVEFYRRLMHLGWDYGLTSSVGMYANDFEYNQERYMKARWAGVKRYNMLQRYRVELLNQAKQGNIFRSTIYDPESIMKFNPMFADGKTYAELDAENLEWYKQNVQADFSDGTPSWLEKTDPGRWEAFKPRLIGKLRYIGDNKRADAVEKGEL
jgi:hypothetical protein